MPDSRLILFGSQAWGKPHQDSDIDLIVISNTFKHKKSFERAVELYRLWNVRYPVDFLCYTPQEFAKLSKMVTIAKEAAEKGIII
ncbi:nucleotidyltransferase domain-containing protein [Candidatus Woesearchaeota archaeon]|nr:nucleotidyltransferase domain-containing protein [Candidatus Woesearchaeota archaeon]